MSKENSPLFGIECDAGFYTKAVPHVQYLPTRPDCPGTETLYNLKKYEELCKEIEAEKKLPEDVKKFLLLAATRHIVFDYENIAEYYAHASKEVQELMEKSGLVIIDFEDAIENGFVELTGQIRSLYDEGIAKKKADKLAKESASNEEE